mgnify:CR=1 FL=1
MFIELLQQTLLFVSSYITQNAFPQPLSEEEEAFYLQKMHIPAAVCSSGETVIFETRDCYNNGVVDERFPLGDGEKEVENPITGPLFIQDAEIGDI